MNVACVEPMGGSQTRSSEPMFLLTGSAPAGAIPNATASAATAAPRSASRLIGVLLSPPLGESPRGQIVTPATNRVKGRSDRPPPQRTAQGSFPNTGPAEWAPA